MKAPPRPCLQPGCTALTEGKPRCDKHQRDGRRLYQSSSQKQANSIRSSYLWQIVRDAYRRQNPLCVDPFNEHDGPEPVQSIHHVKPLKDYPDLAFVDGNLRSLCSDCHGRIEQLERGGKPTQNMFE